MPRRSLPHNTVKLDPHHSYPCPCCHQGRLQAIILTDSFGCGRCQQIFAVLPDGHHIEQLGVAPAFRRVWSWNGRIWQTPPGELPQGMAVVGVLALLVLIVVVVVLLGQLGWGLDLVGWIILVVLSVMLTMLLTVMMLRS